ncbi:hypothetical protein TU65_14990, partial [Bacillus wiedmannii]|uniref:non-ribosomal peptide synthetase n=1 Tax=Bacillus wiedmannii TaxID=1890302 RepID=UPI00065BB86C
AVTVSDIDITTDDERHQLLEEFNKTQVDYSRGKTLQELFEAQVDKRPDHIAVKFRNKTLTYRELNEKSNQLARVLRQKGVNPNSIVGLMIESSLDMMIGILGILKSGGAYLPIDPTHPQDRIHYMMKDAEIQVLVTANDCAKKLSFEGTTVDISDLNNFTGDKTNVDIINQSSDLAYVIYTSGTTGQAKGVMIPHSSLINYCQAMIKKAVITSEDETALLSSHAFDLGYTTVYTALISGITLHILSEDMYRDPDQLVEYTKTCTYLKMTPSLFSIIIHSEKVQEIVETGSLRLIILGGEPINKNDLKQFRLLDKEYTIRFINHYGPTESTIGCVAGEIDFDQIDEFSNVIGKPLDNIKAYILDPHRNLTPIGVPGELYISGDGLANGYVNKPELTVEKFIENPFDSGKRMYKTGDLVKRLPDGRIEFIGRIDSQVKVRGYRIELGEIENLLLSHPEIKEAAVINRENETGETYLAAYMAGHRVFDMAEVRNYVKDRLPHYMVPAYFMVLDTMPLTKNGKINRKELPEPDSSGMVTTDYAAPENDVQQTLVDIWSDILGVEKIGIHDNFFDLGGHSLKATVLIGKLHKYFDVEIPLSELFEFPTIKHISTYIDDSTKSIYQTIEPCIENEYYETSSAQKRMYMVQKMEKGTLYNMPMICELEGEIDQQRIESAFQKLVIRHDSLRTYFEQIDGEIVQKIQADYSFAIENEYRSNLVAEELLYAFIRSFQLEEAPLFRAKLTMSKEKTYLLVDMHHIISDGVSIRILIKEFMELYNGNELEPLRLQYRDFAVWQNKLLNSEEIKLQEKYWVQKFQDEVPVLNLPYDYDRPLLQSYEGDIRTFYLDGAQTESLRNIARETGSTMHMVMLTAFHILLSKYSGQEDIVIGTPIAGRAHDELQNMIGMFVNTLALRNKAEGTLSFKEFLNTIKRNSILAYENQSYQFEELIDTIQVKRNTSRHPLFDVMFSMNSVEAEEDLITKSLRLKRMNPKSNVSKFDLTLHVVENESTLLYSIEYCTKLFKEETIDRMGLHLNEILKTACEDLNISISAIDIMTKSEKARLEALNSTAREYPREKTLHQLFEEQVVKSPDQTALVMEGQSLTYKELNDKANQVARVLRQKGVQPETIVGLMTERSSEMIIGLMGILKAGGAYLPIDPAHPVDRIGSVLSDAKVDLLVTYGDIPSTLPYAGHVIDLTDQSIYQEEKTNLDVEMTSRHLAYVIYTSGSTGVPKGVMVEHQQVNNFIHGMVNETQLGSYESILCLTTLSFDIFGLETLAPLTKGLTVVVSNEEESKEGEKLAALIERNEIEVMQSTPTRLKMLMENERFRFAMKKLKTLFVGGEELSETLWNEVKGLDFPVFNMYGPTETTIWSTIKHMKETDSITIGKPIQNTQVYVLDRHNQLVPEGVLGELCISGDGVARGYFNREELTREKFVPNPFVPGERMYKTGDLVRWLPTGELAYAGRIDHQVKIRGFRIELGEIETQIISHPQVKEAVVAAKEDEQNQKYLCAYVVSHETLDKSGLKAYLKERLPDYMIPSYMMELDNIPLTNNGKINRTALPEPDINGLISGDYEAPQTALQETLVTIWRDVLGVETIGIHDNFFDLGGHSLKATVVMSDIHKLLQIEVPLKEIFTSPTIFELSGYIEKSTVNVYETIKLCEEQDFYETSSAQKRMYSVQQLDKGSTAYNMPGIFELEGEVDQNRIGTVFQQLVKRHEALRTSYETVDGEIVQKIWPTEEFQIISREHSATDIADIAKSFIQPFELERAPLFRVELAVVSSKQYLMIDMHHIISDGVSMSLLLKEFTKLYNGESLEPLRIQYKDFAQWQNAYLRSGGLDQQAAYWKKQFQGNVPVLHLPYDYERPVIQSFEGDSVHFILDEEMTEGLREVARKEGATLHMILLSAFNILLSKYSGQEDIVVGVPVAGRSHADLRNMMGMFVNTLAMRNRPEKEKTFK